MGGGREGGGIDIGKKKTMGIEKADLEVISAIAALKINSVFKLINQSATNLVFIFLCMMKFPEPTKVWSHQHACSTATQSAQPRGHGIRGPPESPEFPPPPPPPPHGKRERNSRHEEDAPGVGDAASSRWGGVPVIAKNAT